MKNNKNAKVGSNSAKVGFKISKLSFRRPLKKEKIRGNHIGNVLPASSLYWQLLGR